MYQDRIIKKYGENIRIPVFYFTQILGIALDIPVKELGFSRSVIPLNDFWARI